MKRRLHSNIMPYSGTTSFRGFSYVEILLAIILIAVCLVPIMESMQSIMSSTSIYEASIVDQLALQAKIEEVLREPLTALENAATVAGSRTTPTSYSDSTPFTTTDNRQITRNVYLWPYDGDNADGDNDPFTDTDPDLFYVKVEIDGSPLFLETLTSI